MVQIINENRGPNTAEKFSQAISKGLEGGSQLYQAYKQKKQMEEENKSAEEMGIHLKGFKDPDLRKIILKEGVKKKQEDVQKFYTGLETIERMRDIIKKGNVGRGSSFLGFFPGETQRDRGELEQLGKSLIPLVAAGVPIRNQKEFEEYKKIITDPSSPDDRFLGALDGLQRIFEGKINPQSSQQTNQGKGKVAFNINNPEHKAKRNQLMKKFNNDREKVEEMLNREFE